METVLFVCFHNAGRSQMAESFVNRLAGERNLPIHALSAGTVCSRDIDPTVRAVMAEIGYDMKGQSPKLLMHWHQTQATRIITMHCKVDPANCPRRIGECEDWNLQDPAGQPIEIVRRIRDEIRVRVEALLQEVAARVSGEAV